MRDFARLFAELDETTRTGEKVDAMARYFAAADAADAAWAVHFLSGNRPKRLIAARRLAAWAMEVSDVPRWLFEECYHAVGDLAETIALLLPGAAEPVDLLLHVWVRTAEEAPPPDVVVDSANPSVDADAASTDGTLSVRELRPSDGSPPGNSTLLTDDPEARP